MIPTATQRNCKKYCSSSRLTRLGPILYIGTYCKRLLALLLGAAELLDRGQNGVGVERPQDIAEVEGVDLAAAVKVVDGEGEGCPCKMGEVSNKSFLSH